MSALGSLPVSTVAPPVSAPAPPVSAPAPPVTAPAPTYGPSLASLINTTLLSASLLSFGGQRYTPMTKLDFGDEYDYIVVGVGSAGSVVASRLSEESCVTVLALEAGKTPPVTTEIPGIATALMKTPWDWGFYTKPQKYGAWGITNRQPYWPQAKTIGGGSVMNALFYVRGNHQNFDNWVALGATGWGYKDVLPYFKKAEDNRRDEYVASGYHGRYGPLTVHRPRYRTELKGPFMEAAKYLGHDFVDSNGARQLGYFDFQSTMRGGQRCSTAKAYLVPAENRTNLDIVQNARVTKVLIRNRRAVGVLVDYNGQRRVVKARREVIVSAGAVNTPQLLMLSGIGPREELEKHDIPVVADLPVGENLHDHADSYMIYEITNKSVPYWLEKVATGVPEYEASRTGPLASAEFIFLTGFMKGNDTHQAFDFPNFQFFYGEGDPNVLVTFNMDTKVFEKTYAPYAGKPMFICTSCQVQPKSRGTVTLKSADIYDYPIIDPEYLKDPRDVTDIVDGLKNCNKVVETPPVKNFGVRPLDTVMYGCEDYKRDSDEYLECYARTMTFTSSHPVGTCKMGNPNDPTTVVDTQLRVKTIQALRVVDASIMPIITSGNTNAPTIMVAEKASDFIKSTINCDTHAPNIKDGREGARKFEEDRNARS